MASDSVPFASVTVTEAAASRLSAPSITSFRDAKILLSCSVSRLASVTFSIMPSARAWESSPMALNTDPAVVNASAAVPTTVVLICSCTAVFALPVIFGAMAFFFSFS